MTDWNTTSTPVFGHGYCRWCSSPASGSVTYHNGPCPRVKAIEYHPDGTVKRVEFHDGPAEEFRGGR